MYHSFKTNYTNVLSGKVNRSLATVATAATHGLKAKDVVSLDVLPGISTTIVVAYNDYNRRLVIDPRTFTSGNVNTSDNTITISRHGYESGQKVIHTADTSSGGLVDNGIYYVYVVDIDRIKLCVDYYQAVDITPTIVSITSASAGTISPINPNISLEKDQKIVFDLSNSSLAFTNNDVSYSAFDFNLYSDKNLDNLFFTSGETDDFNISKTGRIGIDATATLTIKNVEEISEDLNYNLTPINEVLNSDVKKEIIRDDINNNNSNSISWDFNSLSGSHSLVGVGTTTFSFSVEVTPQKLEYVAADGDFSYITNSLNAYGPISVVKIISEGKGYKPLPGISTITSIFGKGAILNPKSSNIGRISNVDIKNIGFDYSADKSLRPQAQIPQLIEVDALTSLKRVGITSVGTNYLNSPGLVVLDGLTNKIVRDIDLDYELGDDEVTILRNSKILNDATPTILPISNSNGISINDIDYDSGNNNVTVTIGASFSDSADYPFEVGKKVMIEGVSVGVGSTGKGYNSESYNYTLFEILETDPNIGGALGAV